MLPASLLLFLLLSHLAWRFRVSRRITAIRCQMDAALTARGRTTREALLVAQATAFIAQATQRSSRSVRPIIRSGLAGPRYVYVDRRAASWSRERIHVPAVEPAISTCPKLASPSCVESAPDVVQSASRGSHE